METFRLILREVTRINNSVQELGDRQARKFQ